MPIHAKRDEILDEYSLVMVPIFKILNTLRAFETFFVTVTISPSGKYVNYIN
jgi:hypothetical protein